MTVFLTILAVASLICSGFTSCVYAYLAWKKSKEPPKDEAWEAAIRLLCAHPDEQVDADRVAELYEQLFLFYNVHGKSKKDVVISLQAETDLLRKLQSSSEGDLLSGDADR